MKKKTEAAATGIEVNQVSAAPMQTLPKVFNMDHPFVFLILSKMNNSILFLGKINAINNNQ